MPDIDSLSIQISSSSSKAITAIDNVITSLERLNGALNNYTDDSKFVKGMGSLMGGLNGIARSINSIDLQKLKSLSTALGTLAGNGEKLAKLNFVQTMADFGAQTQRVNSVFGKEAQEIAKDFSIPKEKINELTASVTKLLTAPNLATFDVASNEIKGLIKQYQTLDFWEKEIADKHKQARKEFANQKIYVSKDIRNQLGDNWNTIRNQIGRGHVTSDREAGANPLDYAKEHQLEAETTLEAVKAIAKYRDSISLASDAQRAAKDGTDMWTIRIDDMRRALEKATAAAANLDNEFVTADQRPDILGNETEVQTEANVITNSVNSVTSAISGMQAQMAQQIENPFIGLIKGLESLDEVEAIPVEKFAGVSQLASTVGRFGSKNADQAIANIPRFGRAFAEMATELAKAPMVSDNLVRLAEALSKYSTQTQKATTNTTKFGTATKFLNTALRGTFTHSMRAHHGFTSLAAIFGRLYANFFLLIRGARALGRAMDYSSSMTEAQNVVSVVFGQQSEKMDEFAQTAIKDFGLAKLSATEFASRFQAMGSTMGITAEKVGKANDFIANKISGNSRAYKELGTSVADMSINLTKLTADMASLYNQDYADVAQDMQAVYTGMTRPLRKYGIDLTQATLKEWAMANGLEYDIEKMTQAEKAMLRYQYVMTRASGAMGDFTKTADTWANALRTVKQLLQEVARTIGEALINALRPALLAFRDFLFNFLELTQNALNALGKLMGWKQINFGGASLVDDTEDYAEALDDAGDAAKKLKGQLRGIDELNNLTTNDKSGSGSDGLSGIGADITDWLDSIEDTEEDYESDVKDWFDFGNKISTAIREGLENIDWPTIKGKVADFGHNLASFLNGLIQPDTFKEVGKTIGNALMTAVEGAFAFGKEFGWENLGNSIAEGISGFFEGIEGGKLADTVDVWVQGLFTALKTAVNKLFGNEEKRNEIMSDITGFIFGLDSMTVKILAGASIGVLGAAVATSAIAAAISANPVTIAAIGITILSGYLVGTKISDIFDDAFGTNKKTGESNWYTVWEKGFDHMHLDELIRSLQEGSIEADHFWSIVLTGGTTDRLSVSALIDDIVNFPKNIAAIGEAIITYFRVDFKDDLKYELQGVWDDTFGYWKTSISEGWDEIKTWFDKDSCKELFAGIKDGFEEDINEMLGFFSETIPEWINEEVVPFFSEGKWKELLSGMKNAFVSTFKSVANMVVECFNKILEGIEKFINGSRDFFNGIIDVASAISGKDLAKWDKLTIPKIKLPFSAYANGGYPQVGSLFLAGEAGSEMVGTINGRTGVVSNGEITGIADAIRSTSDTEIQLLRQQNTLLQGILNKEFGITSDSIFKSVRSSAREYTNMTGQPAW